MHVRVELGEDFFGPLANRSFQPPELFIRFEGQHAIVGPPFVEFLQGEFQQRQRMRILPGGFLQLHVEAKPGRRVDLESQAGGAGGLHDHLTDFAQARRQEIVLTGAFLHRHQLRQFSTTRIEVAAHCGHDPHRAPMRQSR